MKLIIKAIFFTCVISQISLTGISQNLPRLGLYMFNQQVYNPAAFGTGEAELNASLFYRNQWSIDGAPRTFGGWGDYRFTQKQMAVGVNINYSKIGISTQKDFLLNYSYQIPITKKMKVSAGLRAGIASKNADPGELEAWHQDDSKVDELEYSATFAKIGAGFQVYSSRFYAGVASQDLYTGDKSFTVDNNKSTFSQANYVAYTGGIIELNDSYRLLPSMIAYLGPTVKSRVDGTLLLEVKQYFYAGVTATTNKQFVLSGGAYLSPRLRFGYAYQFENPGDVGNLNTHELNIRFLADNLFK